MTTQNHGLTIPSHMNQSLEVMEDAIEEASTDYLGKLALQFGVSKAVKVLRTAREGDYMLNGKNLGETFKIVPLVIRYHADQWNSATKTKLGESFDLDSDEYKRLAKLAKIKNSGAKAGPEILCLVTGIKKFGVIRFSRSSLRAAADFAPHMGKVITISTKRVGGNDTPVPIVKDVHEGATYDAPEAEYAEEMLRQFIAPTLEKPAEPAGGER